MHQRLCTFAVVALLATLLTPVLRADVRSEEVTKFQLGGALGKVVSIFGGRAAREGVTSVVAVKGDRRIRRDDASGEIVDLKEEKVYQIDFKKKSYTVATFADLQRAMEDARKKAADEARKEQAAEPRPREDAPQFDVDFSVKVTGEKKVVNGFDTHEAVMTITVREKGKTLEQSGGVVMTSSLWLAPTIPALREVGEFEMRYAQKLYGPMLAGANPRDMASAMAMYPQVKPALEKAAVEARKLDGTPVLTSTTLEAVKSAAMVAEEQKAGNSASANGSAGGVPTSVGSVLGGFARRAAQRKAEEKPAASDRASIMTTSTEILKVATTVADADLAVPAGFKLAQ